MSSAVAGSSGSSGFGAQDASRVVGDGGPVVEERPGAGVEEPYRTWFGAPVRPSKISA